VSETDSRTLSTIAEAAPIAMVVADAAGVLRSVNEQALHLFGYESSELIGKLIDTLIPHRFREGHPALRAAYTKAASLRPMGAGRDLFGLRKDGSEVPVEIGLNAFATSEGLFVLAVIIDISERKHVEEHLRQIIDAAPNAKVLVTAEGEIALVNAEARRLFGYSLEEMIGSPVDMLLPERFRPGHAGLRASFVAAPSTRRMGAGRDLYGLRKDGQEVPVEIGLGPINTPKGQFVLASIVEITERKHAEMLRLASAGVAAHNAELEVLNKELESFSYSVSHDLRAPVLAIHGYARMLEKRAGDTLDEESRRLLSVVRSEATRMGLLIDDILELSRLGRRQMRIVWLDMDKLVAGTVRDLVARNEADGVTFQLEHVPPAPGDLVQLRSVWENLISNAVKYSRNSDPPTVRVFGETDGDRAVYHVKDNGVGFDMKYAHKLFGVFQRLHAAEDFAGTGVGLAIVSRVISRHRGQVWGEAEPGRGALFSFSLPLVQIS
jgi:PAS domain S-box-containing protein